MWASLCVFCIVTALFAEGTHDAQVLREVKQALGEFHYFVPRLAEALEKVPGGYEPLSLNPEDARCVNDLYKVLNGTTHFEMWALQMIDSASKIPSGILEGNIVDLGQFDECVQVDTDDFSGQHCLLTIGVDAKNKSGIIMQYVTSFTLALCFPSTCSRDTINSILARATSPLAHAIPGITITFSILEHDCHTSKKPPPDTGDWIMICICCAFAVLALLSTAVDYMVLKGETDVTRSEAVLKSFSLYSNGKKLFNTKKTGDEMSCINGIKFLSMAWVILGHKYCYTMPQPSVNLIVILDYMKQWTKMFIVNGTLSVDTFFMMSGLLNAYSFFTIVNKKRKYNIMDALISYLHRFIRLSPPYYVMVGITATFIYRIGSGPIWDRVILPPRETCQKYWWEAILYITDYEDNCLDQGWYLGADLQMFILSPILLYPMWRWTAFGMIWYAILFLGSMAIPFAISYSYGVTVPFPLVPMTGGNPLTLELIYLPVHTRLSTYIIGIMVGYLLYKIRNGALRFRMSKLVAFIGWLIAGVFLLYPIYGGYWFYQSNPPYGQLADSFYIALFRPMWGIGVGWVILACITGHGGIVNKMLSLSVFRPLGRLSYCTYLTHMAVIRMGLGLAKEARHLDDYSFAQEYLGDLFISLTAASVLSLLLEAPTLALEKILLGNLRTQVRRNNEPTRGQAGA